MPFLSYSRTLRSFGKLTLAGPNVLTEVRPTSLPYICRGGLNESLIFTSPSRSNIVRWWEEREDKTDWLTDWSHCLCLSCFPWHLSGQARSEYTNADLQSQATLSSQHRRQQENIKCHYQDIGLDFIITHHSAYISIAGHSMYYVCCMTRGV